MNPIITTEDALIATVKSVVGQTVREAKTLPGSWTRDTLRNALQMSPAVYAAFLGASNGTSPGHLNGRFSVYCVTKGASDQIRRRGNQRVIGAYDLLSMLTPVLDGMTVTGVGTLQLRGIENLFRDAMFNLGGTVYAIQLLMANMPFDCQVDSSALDDFETFDAVYDINLPTGSGEPEANDHLTGLDQL